MIPDDATLPVSGLLPDDFEGLPIGVAHYLRGERQSWARLTFGLVLSQATERLRAVLDFDAFDMVAKAWAIARVLREFTDPARHPPDRIEVAEFGEHTLTANAHPVLQVSVAGANLEPMRLNLEITATFEAVALSIQGGEIIAAAPGPGTASALLKYRDTPLHKPLESREIRLPAKVTFNPGLRIP